MLARLLCWLLGHALEGRCTYEGGPTVYVARSKCARCGVAIVEVIDLTDE